MAAGCDSCASPQLAEKFSRRAAVPWGGGPQTRWIAFGNPALCPPWVVRSSPEDWWAQPALRTTLRPTETGRLGRRPCPVEGNLSGAARRRRAAVAAKIHADRRKFLRENEISGRRGARCFSAVCQNLSLPLYWTVTRGGRAPPPDAPASRRGRHANIVWHVSDYGAFREPADEAVKGNPQVVPISVTTFFAQSRVVTMGHGAWTRKT
jgi:hypothetical protein